MCLFEKEVVGKERGASLLNPSGPAPGFGIRGGWSLFRFRFDHTSGTMIDRYLVRGTCRGLRMGTTFQQPFNAVLLILPGVRSYKINRGIPSGCHGNTFFPISLEFTRSLA